VSAERSAASIEETFIRQVPHTNLGWTIGKPEKNFSTPYSADRGLLTAKPLRLDVHIPHSTQFEAIQDTRFEKSPFWKSIFAFLVMNFICYHFCAVLVKVNLSHYRPVQVLMVPGS
jgi:hypothetical protein